MKISLLYGPGEAAKRAQLLKIKQSYPVQSVTTFDLKQQDFKEVELVLRSRGLFETDQRLLVVENTPKGLDLKEFNLTDESTDLVLVAPALEVSSKLLKSAQAQKRVEIYKFEADKELSAFNFLDNLIEGKSASFSELEKLLKEYGAVYILTMIYYLIRRNILPQTSPFMQKKVQQQKAHLTESGLEKLYQLTLETEFKIKSGLIEERLGLFNLTSQIIGQVTA